MPALTGRIVKMTSTRPDAPARVGRSLTPVEMAQAAVMGSLSSALSIASVVVPFAGGLALLVTVPMGLLALRYRFRVLVAAAFAASSIAFLIAGISGFMVVLNCAYVGGMTGIIKRRGRGTPAVIVASIVAGAILGLISVALLIFWNGCARSPSRRSPPTSTEWSGCCRCSASRSGNPPRRSAPSLSSG